jgi:cytochrome P450
MSLPPGPPSPAAVQTWRFIARPFPFFEECRRNYGELFSIKLVGIGPSVHVCRPETVRELFHAPVDRVHAGDSNAVIEPMVGWRSVALIDEAEHARIRRVLNVPLHGPKMRRHGQTIADAARRAISPLRLGETRPMLPLMQDISLEVIMRVIFGASDEELPAASRAVMQMVLAYTAPLLLVPPLRRDLGKWSPGGRFLRRRQIVDDWIYKEISARRATPEVERVDVLSLLLGATDGDGRPLTDREIRDQLMTLFVAGQDTTSTALAWTLAHVHANPEARERLDDEIAALGADPDPDALCALPYLSAVCNESLRIIPTVMAASRLAVKRPFTLEGFDIPPKVYISPNVYLIHRNPEVFPEPEKFRPERFLDREYQPWEFLPWGGGARRCIGMALSFYEMRIVLGTILSELRMAAAQPGVPRALNRGMVISPEGGTRLRVVERRRVQRVAA